MATVAGSEALLTASRPGRTAAVWVSPPLSLQPTLPSLPDPSMDPVLQQLRAGQLLPG